MDDNFTAVRDGLVAVVQGVTDIKGVLHYEPTSIQTGPLAWVLLDSFERAGAPAGVIGRRLRFMVRIAVSYQDPEGAEDALIAAALQVADEIERNKQFSGAITRGIVVPADGRAGWINVGGTKCRVVDVFTSAYTKNDY